MKSTCIINMHKKTKYTAISYLFHTRMYMHFLCHSNGIFNSVSNWLHWVSSTIHIAILSSKTHWGGMFWPILVRSSHAINSDKVFVFPTQIEYLKLIFLKYKRINFECCYMYMYFFQRMTLVCQNTKKRGKQTSSRLYGALSGSKLNVQTFSSLNFETSLFAYNYFLIAALFPVWISKQVFLLTITF